MLLPSRKTITYKKKENQKNSSWTSSWKRKYTRLWSVYIKFVCEYTALFPFTVIMWCVCGCVCVVSIGQSAKVQSSNNHTNAYTLFLYIFTMWRIEKENVGKWKENATKMCRSMWGEVNKNDLVSLIYVYAVQMNSKHFSYTNTRLKIQIK